MALALTCADLSAYWRCEETGVSDVRQDAKGANHLTPTNSVSGVAGIQGTAASFSGTSWLGRASTTPLTMSGNVSFSLAGWAFLVGSGTQGLLWKGTNVSVLADYEWRLNTSGSNLLFAVTDGTGGHQGVVTTSTTWSTSTVFFWACWYDGTNVRCSINDGTVTSTAYTWGSWAGSHALGLGASGNGASIISNGSWLDETMVLKGYAFTAADITALYNGGAGISYTAICPVTDLAWLNQRMASPALREAMIQQRLGSDPSSYLGPGWGRLVSGERNRLVRG